MISRRFELVVDGVDLPGSRRFARSREHRDAPVWVRIRERRNGTMGLLARVATHEISSFGGSYVPNGTLRGTIEEAGTGADVAVRITGRIRWGMLTYVLALMLALAAFIIWVAATSDGPPVAWTLLAPLIVVAVALRRLLRLRRTDPELLASRLPEVLRGEEHQNEWLLRKLAEGHHELRPFLDRPGDPPTS